jgi:hypothetical protein
VFKVISIPHSCKVLKVEEEVWVEVEVSMGSMDLEKDIGWMIVVEEGSTECCYLRIKVTLPLANSALVLLHVSLSVSAVPTWINRENKTTRCWERHGCALHWIEKSRGK